MAMHEEEERLGDVLSGRLADAEINSMEEVRIVRERGQNQ
jgi:hypothetical protein